MIFVANVQYKTNKKQFFEIRKRNISQLKDLILKNCLFIKNLDERDQTYLEEDLDYIDYQHEGNKQVDLDMEIDNRGKSDH
jgi:hypothetical protein